MVVESKGYWRWPPLHFPGPTISKRYTTLRDATQRPAITGLDLAEHQCFPADAKCLELGKYAFIYGPNGSGKSTVLRELRRDDRCADGEIDLRTFDQRFIRGCDGAIGCAVDEKELDRPLFHTTMMRQPLRTPHCGQLGAHQLFAVGNLWCVDRRMAVRVRPRPPCELTRDGTNAPI